MRRECDGAERSKVNDVKVGPTGNWRPKEVLRGREDAVSRVFCKSIFLSTFFYLPLSLDTLRTSVVNFKRGWTPE